MTKVAVLYPVLKGGLFVRSKVTKGQTVIERVTMLGSSSLLTGTVTYIHPDNIFYMVEFIVGPDKVPIRECYLMFARED